VEANEPASGAATRLKVELDRLNDRHSIAEQSLEVGRDRAALVGKALSELFDQASPGPRTALAALGGFGRGLLAPYSDIDILLLHDGGRPAEVEALAERLLYPLWDAGFTVGHAVRTDEECAAIAEERLDALTSMLDIRGLAGDASLTSSAARRIHTLVRRDPDAFVARLREATSGRHERAGSTAHLLEPDLKEGSGGLRDVDSLRWLEAALGASLLDKGVLRASERSRLDQAREFLFRVRSAIHLLRARPGDRLAAEHQQPIASALGFADEPGLRAADALMTRIFEHARDVEFIVGLVFDRLAGEPGSEPTATLKDVEGIIDFMADASEARSRPSAGALDAIESVDVPDDAVWADATRDSFLRILRTGDPGVRLVDALDRLGLLTRLIPEWADVRCRPQRDPYHRFTVDAHLLHACASMALLLSVGEGSDQMATEAAAAVADEDGALLGALLHDIGKNGRGGHVAGGARIAEVVLDRMGIPEPTRDLALSMVENHLVLPDTATRRDLSDDDLIRDVAERVGSPEQLAALYLLAVADAQATGPAAWTPWRQALIRELVTKVQARFEDRGTPERSERIARRLTERTERIRELLKGEPSGIVDGFILRMPRAYFLAIAPERVAEQFPSIWPPIGTHDVRTATTEGSRPGAHELLVVASDRPGLLSWIAGSLSLAGMSIRSAQVFTTDDGTAVDVFDVEGVFEEEIDEERWRGFRSTLRKAIDGRISLESRVAEKRSYYPEHPGRFAVTIKVDSDVSDFFTVIEVGAADRIGLLYDITRALSDLRLDVHIAKVATYSGRVVDSFYVRDAASTAEPGPLNPERVADIQRRIRRVLEA
jgi:[protein-PII] uridylyltransferase